MFLADNEFILFMDCVNDGMVTVDELKQLRQAGVRTLYRAYTDFDKFYFKGTPNWNYFDDYLERADAAGMKSIHQLWQSETYLGPANWYAKKAGGQTRALSPWCVEAQEYNRDIIRMIIKRYSGSNIMFVTGQHQGNERVLRNSAAYFDEHALADWQKEHDGKPDHRTSAGAEWLKKSYIKLMTDLAKIFMEQPQREVWFNLSRYKATVPTLCCHGCEWIDDYLVEWKKLKPAAINHISFNFFPYPKEYQDTVISKSKQFGTLEFAGAEYAQGLKAGNGARAVELGLRGMIIGPTHPFSGYKRIEPWMIDEIGKTQKLFEARQ